MCALTGRVAVTGAYRFSRWHLGCRLAVTQGMEPVHLGRTDPADA
jgi:hypothetical protein